MDQTLSAKATLECYFATSDRGQATSLYLGGGRAIVIDGGLATDVPSRLLRDLGIYTVLSGRSYMSCGQAEQPVGRGLNLLLGDPGA